MSHIGYQAQPLSRLNIRELAFRVRDAVGFAEKPYIDVEMLLDLVLPRVLPDFAYAVCPMAEMGKNEGLANPEEHWIKLREDVFGRACDGHGRDRLTVVHEFAHLLLHTRDRIVLCRAEGSPKTYCDPEWQADCFAGEFLVSARHTDGCRTPDDLVERFGVTPSAAKVQWDQLRRSGIL